MTLRRSRLPWRPHPVVGSCSSGNPVCTGWEANVRVLPRVLTRSAGLARSERPAAPGGMTRRGSTSRSHPASTGLLISARPSHRLGRPGSSFTLLSHPVRQQFLQRATAKTLTVIAKSEFYRAFPERPLRISHLVAQGAGRLLGSAKLLASSSARRQNLGIAQTSDTMTISGS